MNKKLMAVAVAGAFAVPTIAAAQVTVSGKLGIQLTNVRISNTTAARAAAGLNTSETMVNDNATILRIGAREDLGGGLEAFGQYEIRPNLDGSNTGLTTNLPVGSSTGVSYVGLRSSSLGTVKAGTMTTWGDGQGSGLSPDSSQHYSTSGMMNYVMIGGTTVSFSSSRQPNVIMYDMPTMGGLNASFGYSSDPFNTTGTSSDTDLASATRKGQAYYILPNYTIAGIGKIGYAYANIKSDSNITAAFASQVDLKANKIYGEFNLAGIEFGLTWSKITATNVSATATLAGGGAGATAAGTRVIDTTKWHLPVRYKVGKNTFAFMYMKNNDDKAQLGDQGSKQLALSYNYNFSNRTNAGISWVRLKNNAAGTYDITSQTGPGYGAIQASLNAGETMNLISLSLNHNF